MLSDDVVRDAAEWRRLGLTYREIGERLGVGRKTIATRLRKDGFVQEKATDIVERSCELCGTVYVGMRGSRYCSDACRTEAMRRTSARYWSRKRERPPEMVEATCERCGAVFTKRAGNTVKRYCSVECCREASKTRPCTRKKTYKPKPKRPIVQETRKCIQCESEFTCPVNSSKKYCAQKCAWRYNKHTEAGREVKRNGKRKRRAVKKGAFVAPVSFRQIALRDKWKCQLCGKPVKRKAKVPDPLAPTLDHIIPFAKGGTHEPKNVQLAHFLCNSLKSDQEAGQLRFIG